jgi:hypothetical protein
VAAKPRGLPRRFVAQGQEVKHWSALETWVATIKLKQIRLQTRKVVLETRCRKRIKT